MIITRFLEASEHPKYGDWLKSQDDEAKQMFFGYVVTDENIDALIQRVVENPRDNYFLLAHNGKGEWLGTLHLAVVGNEVEFGFMIQRQYRGQRIASRLMEEGLLWVRNRGYKELFLHCLTHNVPVRKLCKKHGLIVTSMHSESETKVPVPPPDLASITLETAIRNRQVWRTMLSSIPIIDELYG
jgi:RimJ/RimL family protein N-acetyltransferase